MKKCLLILLWVSIPVTVFCQKKNTVNICLESSQKKQVTLNGRISVSNQNFSIFSSDTCLSVNYGNKKNIVVVFESESYKTQIIEVKLDTLGSNPIKIPITEKITELQEVKVVSNQRIYQRGDTTIIKTDSIFTRPHSSATELMNKIPGVSMDMSGQLNILGKNVDNITVEGKPLFGGNTKATLESLNSDMIKQLEVVQDANGGNSLDIKLKSNKQNGWYGEIGGNVGTSETYGGTGRLNKISPKYFANFFLTQNNFYERSISSKDKEELRRKSIFKGVKGAYSLVDMAIPESIVSTESSRSSINKLNQDIKVGNLNSLNGGLNLSKTTAKFDIFGTVLFDDYSHNVNRLVNLSQPLPPYNLSSKITNSINDNQTKINSYFNIKATLNPKNTISFIQNTYFNNFNKLMSEQQNNKLFASDSVLSEGVNNRFDNFKDKNWATNQQLLWVHKFKKPANFTSFYVGYNSSEETFNQVFRNNVQFFNQKSNNSDCIEGTKQFQLLEFQWVYSKPINKALLMELKSNFLRNNATTNQNGFNIELQKETVNEGLSIDNYFTKDKQFINQASFYYKTGKFTAIASPVYWLWTGERIVDKKSNSLTISNDAFYVNSFLEYRSKRGMRISFRNYLSQTLASSDKLQIIPDSSNLQSIFLGNATLTNSPKITSELNFMGTFNNNYLSLNGKYELERNQIIANNSINTFGNFNRGYTQFGEGNNYNLTTVWYQFNRTKPSSFYILNLLTWQESSIFISDKPQPINSFISMIFGNLKWTINPYLDLKLDLKQTYSSQKLNDISNSNINREATLKVDKNWNDKVYTDVNITYFSSSNSLGQSNNYTIFDISAYQYFLKNNKFRVIFLVKNLLNVNTLYTNNISQFSQREEFINRLPRIFMVGLTYYIDRWK